MKNIILITILILVAGCGNKPTQMPVNYRLLSDGNGHYKYAVISDIDGMSGESVNMWNTTNEAIEAAWGRYNAGTNASKAQGEFK